MPYSAYTLVSNSTYVISCLLGAGGDLASTWVMKLEVHAEAQQTS